MISNFDEYFTCINDAVSKLKSDYRYQIIYEDMIKLLLATKDAGGRLFIIGMGGSAANAQHMANDFRKIAGMDAICLSDNIAELTARANDDGFDSIYINSLKVSNFEWKDALFVLSVSGGNREKNASMALVKAMEYALSQGGFVLGVVGMSNSETKALGTAVIVTPQPSKYLTQVAESLQPIIWHGLVSDERLMENKAKW